MTTFDEEVELFKANAKLYEGEKRVHIVRMAAKLELEKNVPKERISSVLADYLRGYVGARYIRECLRAELKQTEFSGKKKKVSEESAAPVPPIAVTNEGLQEQEQEPDSEAEKEKRESEEFHKDFTQALDNVGIKGINDNILIELDKKGEEIEELKGRMKEVTNPFWVSDIWYKCKIPELKIEVYPEERRAVVYEKV